MSFGRRTFVGLLAWASIGSALGAEVHLLDPGTLSPLAGETVTLQFHIEGLPAGTRVKAKGLHGQAKARPVTRAGMLVVDYRVPRYGPLASEVLTLRSRSLGLEESFDLQFTPRAADLDTLRFDPEWVESRPGGSAFVEVRSPKHSTYPPWLRTSLGDLTAPRSEGEDWVWTWSSGQTPEASAVVGFMMMDPRQPDQPAAWGALPIHITQSLTIKAQPGYICELVQGEQHSEGVAVTPAGTLAMTVAVDPTKTAAIVDCVNLVGQQRRYPVELQLGDVPRLTLGALPERVPADPESAVALHLLVLDPDGEPAQGSAARIQCSSGIVSELEKTPMPGIWRASWSPDPKSDEVQCTARHNGHEQELSLRTVPGTRSMTVDASPSVLGPDQTVVEIEILSEASGAEPPPGLPAVSTRGASRVTRLRATEDGASQKLRLLRGRLGIWILSSPPPSPLGLPPTDVLAWAPAPVFLADGQSERPVAIAVTDAFGQGVANVAVTLSVQPPDRGSIRQGTVTTSANGLAWIWVRSGSEDGPLMLRAVIEAEEATAPLHALPSDGEICATKPERCEPPSFIIDGDARSRQLERAWRERAPLTWIPYRDAPEADLADLAEEGSPIMETSVDLVDLETETSGPATVEGTPATAPRLRLSAGPASLSHVYSAESKLGAAAPSPQSAQKGNLLEGNPVGSLAGSAHLLVRLGEVYIDGGWLGGRVYLGTEEDLDPAAFHQGWLGLRRGFSLAPGINAHLGAAADYQSFHVLVFDLSNLGELMLTEIPAPGARISAGLSWSKEKVWTELEFSEALVPWPVRSTGSLRVHVQTLPGLITSIGVDMSFRSALLSAGADEISVHDQLHVLSLGLGTTR